MQTITTIKPIVNIETGLRAAIRADKGNRNYRVILRIDWETGDVNVIRRHNSEGTSFLTYNNFRSEWTLSNKLTNKAIGELVADMADQINTAVSGWSTDLNTDRSNVVGRFSSGGWDAVLAIRDRIDLANEAVDGGHDTCGGWRA